ncbi:hypothetical protein [Algoriphagus sp.]|uniref:hypothetical protein n=1 Tax=Algoriphagus sp. TaxID=1872435 RepID=UPI00391DDAD1
MVDALNEMKSQLMELNQAMSGVEEEFAGLLNGIHSQNRESAVNFLKYLILRRTDFRHLQLFLHENGLSSLASCESHTHRQIQVTLTLINSSHR